MGIRTCRISKQNLASRWDIDGVGLMHISEDGSYPRKRWGRRMGLLCGDHSARFSVVAAGLSDVLCGRGLGRVFFIEFTKLLVKPY
ncbi:hypothetical protein AVEN_75161-1 [Araneus ventricosus]|uniref:Uncharacterized protein n=1 Tax=Araneus ventricosus TaxID=182803 RepID=A0A4Y2LD14_ARAVE|nr:hypothetical protein AVEN_75161-1 [Araneus ventricosus]